MYAQVFASPADVTDSMTLAAAQAAALYTWRFDEATVWKHEVNLPISEAVTGQVVRIVLEGQGQV